MASPANAPTLDREVRDGLREQLGGQAMANLAEHFSERAPLVDELVRVSRGPNCEELVRVAREVRGGASIVAATRLAELANELEERGRARQLSGTHRLARETAAEYDRALAAMTGELAPAE